MIFIDGHVHLWKQYDWKIFFNNAFSNFSAVAAQYDCLEHALFALFLSETIHENSFADFVAMAQNNTILSGVEGDISFRILNDGDALMVNHSAYGNEIMLVPGQQVVSSEGIEVLGCFTVSRVPSGLDLKNTFNAIRANCGLVVLPWGVGKWLGKRGHVLDDFLFSQKDDVSSLMLGDNGNRPWFWPKSGIMRLADKYQMRVLAGSDPLNLSNGSSRVGSFGSLLDMVPSKKNSLEQIRNAIRNPDIQFASYGRLQGLLSFLYSQVALRVS